MRRIGFCVLIGLMLVLLGPSRGISQFPSGGSRGDPSKMFDLLSGGKDVATKDTLPSPFLAKMFDSWAEKVGSTNGQITREQFNAYIQQQSGGKTATPAAAPMGSPASDAGPSRGGFRGGFGSGPESAEMMDKIAESMFRKLDANGDGYLNNDEMTENLRLERDKWDTNKDGVIDLNEYKEYFKAAMQHRMNEANSRLGMTDTPAIAKPADPDDEDEPKPAVYRAGKLPKELPSWFKTVDTDNDGQITMAEWRAAGKSIDEFIKLDRNGDGFLTIAEVMYSVQGKNYLNGVAVNAPTPTDPRTASEGGGRGPGGPGGSFKGGGGASGLGEMFKAMMGGGGFPGGGSPGTDTKGGAPSDTKAGKGGAPSADEKGKGKGSFGRPAGK